MTVNELKKFATDVRIETVKCLEARTFGHIGGCLSIADVLTVLYNGELKNIDPADPKKLDRDMLVVSKGHAGPAVFATLALKGYFPLDWLPTLCEGGTRLPSHCDRIRKYVDEVGSPNCKILLDTYHMNIEEDSFAGAIKLVGNRLGHFHVGESNRRPPCENGKMPWNEITNALKEIDYQGAIVMEPFIKMGGEVGRDIKVWRDISEGASESEMEQLLADAAMMLRKKMQR